MRFRKNRNHDPRPTLPLAGAEKENEMNAKEIELYHIIGDKNNKMREDAQTITELRSMLADLENVRAEQAGEIAARDARIAELTAMLFRLQGMIVMGEYYGIRRVYAVEGSKLVDEALLETRKMLCK
jgi:hypothetical protein